MRRPLLALAALLVVPLLAIAALLAAVGYALVSTAGTQRATAAQVGALAAAQAVALAPPPATDPACLPGGSVGQVGDLTADQLASVAVIISVGRSLSVPDQGIVVALAAARQESGFRANLTEALSDRDSAGLFQQRRAWAPDGSEAYRMDPANASRMFYTGGHGGQRGLLDIPGWQSMSVAQAAQAVQVSAFPDAYAQWEQLARSLLAGYSPGPAGPCVPPGTALDCPPSGLPVEAGLTPDAVRVVRCVVATFGLRNLGGKASSGHIEGSAHYTGRAVDVMIPGWETSPGNELGWRVAEWARANREGLGVTEVIFDAQIWTLQRDGEDWRAYSYGGGPASGATAQHLDHVHITVSGNAGKDAAPPGGGPWTQPVARGSYRISSRYEGGYRSNGGHSGTDLAAPEGTEVRAASAGRIVSASYDGAYGNLTKIDHGNGIETWYAHQLALDVGTGATVAVGQAIGRVGSTGNSTGPHLHFEVRINGQMTDPEPFMADHGAPL